MRPVASSSLTGAIGPHRRWSWAEVRLTDVKTVRAELGGTVNDVVLTMITGGFRALLESRGEPPGPDDVVRTMVPVSVRRRGEQGVYNNRVSAVFAGLPVGLDDPRARLASIRARDGRHQADQAGRRRRRAVGALGLCAADAPGAREPRRDAARRA